MAVRDRVREGVWRKWSEKRYGEHWRAWWKLANQINR